MRSLIVLFLTFSSYYAIASNNGRFLADTTRMGNNKVLYEVSLDGDYVNLIISTKDRMTTMSIIRSGLTVYYDIKGKKKKNVYVKYPYNNEPKELRPGGQRNNNANPFDLKSVVDNMPIEAEYGFYKEKEVFSKVVNSLDISIETHFTSSKQLFELLIKIPKALIDTQENSDFSKLSIGVVSNKTDGNNGSAQRQNTGMRGGGGGGGRGGSGGGGGGGGRGGNGGGGTGHQGGQRPGATAEKVGINYWFDAK